MRVNSAGYLSLFIHIVMAVRVGLLIFSCALSRTSHKNYFLTQVYNSHGTSECWLLRVESYSCTSIIISITTTNIIWINLMLNGSSRVEINKWNEMKSLSLRLHTADILFLHNVQQKADKQKSTQGKKKTLLDDIGGSDFDSIEVS